MAREAGQSFLPAGTHRQLSHRLSRLTKVGCAYTQLHNMHSVVHYASHAQGNPDGANKAALSQGKFLLSECTPTEWWHLASIPNQPASRRSRLGGITAQHVYGGHPAIPPGRLNRRWTALGKRLQGAAAGRQTPKQPPPNKEKASVTTLGNYSGWEGGQNYPSPPALPGSGQANYRSPREQQL